MSEVEPYRRGHLQQHADAADRARRGWAMRLAGASWADIAAELGFANHANAVRCVRSYFGKLPQIDRSMEREIWRQRLEELWRQVMIDATEQRPGAVRSGVAVAQRAAALGGLDAPTMSVSMSTGSRLDAYGGDLRSHLRAGGQLDPADVSAYGITEQELAELRGGAGDDDQDIEGGIEADEQ